MVYSVDESGKEENEGVFPMESQADEYAQRLADDYGYTYSQDIDEGKRVVSISIRPIWILCNLR